MARCCKYCCVMVIALSALPPGVKLTKSSHSPILPSGAVRLVYWTTTHLLHSLGFFPSKFSVGPGLAIHGGEMVSWLARISARAWVHQYSSTQVGNTDTWCLSFPSVQVL